MCVLLKKISVSSTSKKRSCRKHSVENGLPWTNHQNDPLRSESVTCFISESKKIKIFSTCS
uniref:Uncharacterized protein n=1 Tax=Anguilla anguilla TaxID=7936 RepID=A0A0E9U741_ANGAN